MRTVIIWRLDRLGRSTKHLIEVVEDLSPPWAAPDFLAGPR
ncbi:recombinase family protein [Hymenobacter bucti]|uniref:Recombinase family protein n=1 Tax=Hymenobacter bucti TaxID=1844114 RepID=A0ABW4R235_9BACT